MTGVWKIKEDILKTICWFDVFDYPMTKEEIWRYGLFIDACSLEEVEVELRQLLLTGQLEQAELFYHLPCRRQLVDERKSRFNYTDQKFKIAMRVAKIFRLIPSIEMIALGNLIGSHNLRQNGDIDLLIVAKPGTIWTTRFVTALIAKLLGIRPTEKSSKDKICLSFFVTSDKLDLEQIAQVDHLYFFYWAAFLTPIYDRNGSFEKFIKANSWIKERLPNFFLQAPHHLRLAKNFRCYVADWLFKVLAMFEDRLKNLQLSIMPDNLKELANKDTRVIVNDQILKFHANDRRQEFQSKFKARFAKTEA